MAAVSSSMVELRFSTGRSASAETRRAETDLLNTFSRRLREARMLNGMGQIPAAEALGYANSSGLSKLELGTYFDDRSIPLLLPVKAARLYGVSTDYLFGLADWYENNPEDVLRHFVCKSLADEWQRTREKDVASILALAQEIGAVSEALREIVDRNGEFQEALDTFVRHNPDFEDQRGGAKLLRTAAELATTVARAAGKLRALAARRVKTDSPVIQRALAGAWGDGA